MSQISDLRWREEQQVRGVVEVARVLASAHGEPMLELLVSDGSGFVKVLFVGYRRIGGVIPSRLLGRRLELSGTVTVAGGELAFMNPAHRFLAAQACG